LRCADDWLCVLSLPSSGSCHGTITIIHGADSPSFWETLTGAGLLSASPEPADEDGFHSYLLAKFKNPFGSVTPERLAMDHLRTDVSNFLSCVGEDPFFIYVASGIRSP
jgi:hypothetical protein